MTDIMSSQKRSALMARIRSKNTKIERALARALKKAGVRYKQHYKGLINTPDFVFLQSKTAVFVDGDFWHGYNWRTLRKKLRDKPYWYKKIKGNIARDRKVTRLLKQSGWRVLRFWEHEVQKSSARCAAKIAWIVLGRARAARKAS